jgi:hypothetical protein
VITALLALRAKWSNVDASGWSRKPLDRLQTQMKLAACSQLDDLGAGDVTPRMVVCDWRRSGWDACGMLVLRLSARPVGNSAYEAIVERRVRVVPHPWVRRLEVIEL